MRRYGLAEACDNIELVLRHVALAQGRTQKVKVLTGTGERSGDLCCLGCGRQGFWGSCSGSRLCRRLLHPLPPSPGNVNMTTLNYSAAAYEFLRDFRAGHLGKVTLD